MDSEINKMCQQKITTVMLGCDHGFARWPNRIKFGLQFGFGGR
jgi:hypothetical protein